MTVPDKQFSIGLLRAFLACIHLGVAIVSFIRPNMIELVKGYVAFGEIANTVTWGVAACLIGLGLVFMPRGSFVLIIWQGLSATLFLTFAILVTGGPTGFTWGSVVYLGLACGSFLVMWFTAFQWAARLRLGWAHEIGERRRSRQNG